MAALLVLRTALEDRTLHHELPGYPEYAQKTRSRLIPGIWCCGVARAALIHAEGNPCPQRRSPWRPKTS